MGRYELGKASITFFKNKLRSPVKIQTRGGEVLTVYVEGQPRKRIEKVYLEGEVRLIFQGEVFKEALR